MNSQGTLAGPKWWYLVSSVPGGPRDIYQHDGTAPPLFIGLDHFILTGFPVDIKLIRHFKRFRSTETPTAPNTKGTGKVNVKVRSKHGRTKTEHFPI